jgi:hypothetical protein
MPEGAAGRIDSQQRPAFMFVWDPQGPPRLVLRVEQARNFLARAEYQQHGPSTALQPLFRTFSGDLHNSCLGARMARSSGSESTSGSDSEDLRERKF